MSLGNPWILLLLPLWLWLLFKSSNNKKSKAFKHQVPDWKGLPWLEIGSPFYIKFRKFLLATIGISLLIAASQPRTEDERLAIDVKGIDIMIALDISTSMKALDYQPGDRFSVAVETLKEFTKSRKTDRIGLVVFAGDAYLQIPLSVDYSLINEVLGSLEMGIIEDGTAIGNALGLAVSHLNDSDAKSKVIILITDGDNNIGNISPESAKELAVEKEIEVHSILVGRGGLVPYPTGRDIFGIMQHRRVEIPINPELLQSISKETGGIYSQAGDENEFNEKFSQLVEKMEKSKFKDEKAFRPFKEYYSYPLAFALFFWLLDLLYLSHRYPLKWLKGEEL